jgi:hypothetical protein
MVVKVNTYLIFYTYNILLHSNTLLLKGTRYFFCKKERLILLQIKLMSHFPEAIRGHSQLLDSNSKLNMTYPTSRKQDFTEINYIAHLEGHSKSHCGRYTEYHSDGRMGLKYIITKQVCAARKCMNAIP